MKVARSHYFPRERRPSRAVYPTVERIRRIIVKKGLAWIVAVGLMSSGSAQAFQGLSERLSLDRPYRGDVYPPAKGASQQAKYRQGSKPARFNIFRYVRIEKTGLQIALYFK